MAKEDIENQWNNLPWELLPPSSKVDFCQLIAGIKPAVRTCVRDVKDLRIADKQLTDLGWKPIFDSKGFVGISRDLKLSKKIIEVDQSPIPHAIQLGHLLGYPKCCSSSIEEMGEDAIDKAAEKFSSLNLKGTSCMLDISQYLEGVALISHVPCSRECQYSLNSALRTWKFIINHGKTKNFDEWALHVIDYFAHCFPYDIS